MKNPLALPLTATPTTRRKFLAAAGTAIAAPALLLPRRAHAGSAQRSIALHNTHTGEALSLVYAHGNNYVPGALRSLSYLLRDFRTGDAHAIEPRLFDQMHVLAAVTGARKPFEIISGYRSPATNRTLRAHSGGVADKSLHLEGKAIDIRLPDVSLADLRDAAISLKAGGVGYYAESRFVHIDTGRVRRW